MTKEELFRALGEVREEQAEEAGEPKACHRLWRRYLAAAACLAVIVTAVLALPRLENTPAQGAGQQEESAEDLGDLDGEVYGAAETSKVRPQYSVNAEIAELDSAAVQNRTETPNDSAACLAFLSQKEILAKDTVIFRGTVRSLRVYEVQAGSETLYYTGAAVEVSDCIRGELTEGETYEVLYTGAPERMTTSLSGDLERLKAGSEAIFMPCRTGRDTGWRSGESYFCYADAADLYFEEGLRFLILDTGEGLSFAKDVYTDLDGAETLDEAAEMIREALEEQASQESFQRAEKPAKPQEASIGAAPEKGPEGGREA